VPLRLPEVGFLVVRSLYNAISALRSFPIADVPERNVERVSWWFGRFLIS